MKTFYEKDGNEVNVLENTDIISGDNYIKFPDGTMICWFLVYIEAGVETKTFSFPVPFAYPPHCFAFHEYAHQAYGYATTSDTTNQSVKVYIKDETEKSNLDRNASVIAIGRWK